MKLILNNGQSNMIFDQETDDQIKVIKKALHEAIDPLDPQRYHVRSFNSHFWDGRRNILNLKADTFPIGLFEDVKSVVYPLLTHYGCSLSIIDNRGEAVGTKSVDKEIELGNGNQKPIIMSPKDPVRGYQYKAVVEALNKQRMIVNSSTGSGKCVTLDTSILTSWGYRTVGQILFSLGYFQEDFREHLIIDIKDKDLYLINMFGLYEHPDFLTFNGVKQIVTITTKDKHKEHMTYNHPLLCVRDGEVGFITAENLVVGDTIVQINMGGMHNRRDKTNLMLVQAALADSVVDTEESDLSYGLVKITKITKGKSEPTFDFSMPQSHSFIAESLVNHNTEIASGIIKEDLKELNPEDKVFFISHTVSIAEQSQKRLEKRLGVPVGFWGSGKKDIKQVTSVMIMTLRNALKKPDTKVKLSGARERALQHMATKIVPYLIRFPNTKAAVQMYVKNHTPKEAYLEGVYEELVNIGVQSKTDVQVQKALQYYVDAYKKLLKSKNENTYAEYEDAKDIVSHVKVIVVDECHHAASPVYQEVLNQIPARQVIGLSGSINKKDELKWTALKGVFTEHTFDVTNLQMIDKGISAKPFISFVNMYDPINLEEMVDEQLTPAIAKWQQDNHKNMSKGQVDLLKYQLAYKLGVQENDKRNQLIGALAVKLANQNNGGVLIVVNSIEHGKLIKSVIESLGKTSYFLRGAVDSDSRREMLSDIEAGKEDILIGTSVIDEGIDLPNLKYLIYASSGSSERVVKQRIGRVLRKSKHKHSTLIFDIVDRTHPLLYAQAKKRYAIYQREGFSFSNKF